MLIHVKASEKPVPVPDLTAHLVEEGGHEELIAMNGVYKQLYETQFRKVIDMENNA